MKFTLIPPPSPPPVVQVTMTLAEAREIQRNLERMDQLQVNGPLYELKTGLWSLPR